MWTCSIFPLCSRAFSLLSPPCRIMCDLWHFVPTVSHTHTFTSPLSSPTNHPPASSSSTTTSSLLSSLSSPQLNITLSSVEEKLQLPHIARLISRRHVRGWEHFIQQVTCGRLRRSSFKVVLSTEACAWSSLDYFTECGGEGEREIEKVCFRSERDGERKPERERGMSPLRCLKGISQHGGVCGCVWGEGVILQRSASPGFQESHPKKEKKIRLLAMYSCMFVVLSMCCTLYFALHHVPNHLWVNNSRCSRERLSNVSIFLSLSWFEAIYRLRFWISLYHDMAKDLSFPGFMLQ